MIEVGEGGVERREKGRERRGDLLFITAQTRSRMAKRFRWAAECGDARADFKSQRRGWLGRGCFGVSF